MGWYANTNAWAEKVSKRISKRQRRIAVAVAVLMLGWGASAYFRWPIEPVFFFIPAFQLGWSSLFMEDERKEAR